MRDGLRRFETEPEAGRRARNHGFDTLLAWHAVIARIDFDGGKLTRVKREHLGRFRSGRVKTTEPVLVRKSARADVDHC